MPRDIPTWGPLPIRDELLCQGYMNGHTMKFIPELQILIGRASSFVLSQIGPDRTIGNKAHSQRQPDSNAKKTQFQATFPTIDKAIFPN